MNVIKRKVFHLGNIDLCGTGKRYPVTIQLQLTRCGGEPTFTVGRDGTKNYTGQKTPEYTELSISGSIGARFCGQCLDEIAIRAGDLCKPERETFRILYDLWKRWHLNGLHAGTPEQEEAVAEWRAAGNRYDYTAACDMLKERGLYEVTFTGKTVGRIYVNEPYRYGHAWVVEDLPESVVEEVMALCRKEDVA